LAAMGSGFILDQERKPDGEGQEEAGKVPALALGI
jgi:hypothetical protein